MRMWLAVHSESGPSVNRDVCVCFVNVRVCREEVVSKNCCEFLGSGEGGLFGQDVDSLFLGICCDDRRIVRFRISRQFSEADD